MASLNALRQQLGISPIVSKSITKTLRSDDDYAAYISLGNTCSYVLIEATSMSENIGQKTLTKSSYGSNSNPAPRDLYSNGTKLDSSGRCCAVLISNGAALYVAYYDPYNTISMNITFSILGYA